MNLTMAQNQCLLIVRTTHLRLACLTFCLCSQFLYTLQFFCQICQKLYVIENFPIKLPEIFRYSVAVVSPLTVEDVSVSLYQKKTFKKTYTKNTCNPSISVQFVFLLYPEQIIIIIIIIMIIIIIIIIIVIIIIIIIIVIIIIILVPIIAADQH